MEYSKVIQIAFREPIKALGSTDRVLYRLYAEGSVTASFLDGSGEMLVTPNGFQKLPQPAAPEQTERE